jgi:PEGA domain
MRFTGLAGVAILAAAISSCASITRGTSANFTIETTPAGAQAVLSTGETCAATPCTLRRPRKEGFTVTLSMPGYQTSTHDIGHHRTTAGTWIGIAGGPISFGIDAATGASHNLDPNPLVVMLVPLAATAEPAPAAN